MKACAICDDRTSLLTCQTVGAICFDCWGSGIHEALKRKKFPWSSNLQTRAQKLYQDAIKVRETISRLSPLAYKKQEVRP